MKSPSTTAPHRATGPAPRWAVTLEFLRALGGVLALPWHALRFAFARDRWRRSVRQALEEAQTKELDLALIELARMLAQ